jgi:membrane carboxypeptidase/penicillin-binding protein
MLFISSIAAQVSERGTGSRTIRGFESIEIGGKQGTSEVKSILF